MEYRAFGDFRKGYAHVKNGTDAEDYAGSYNDPQGRYYIGVICDGHSDNNCFRSQKGARFGCESAVEILIRFFELYYGQPDEKRCIPKEKEAEERLKRSIKQCWDNKVFEDLKQNPISSEELSLLSERVRKIYESGHGLQNIYGATFLVVALCKDFFLSMHIGDGAILCIDADGSYYSPLLQDPKSETGAPASLCDNDLFSREHAFRICVTPTIPLAAVVSSDGIEDCMDSLGYKQFICNLLRKLVSEEETEQKSDRLNVGQKKYFGSCLEYYADKGHGAEDDCSLAAIYQLNSSIPDIRIPEEEAKKLWNDIVQERNNMLRDYHSRKNNLENNLQQIRNSKEFQNYKKDETWIASHKKLEEVKDILRKVIENEKEKLENFDQRLQFYLKYMTPNMSGMTKKLKPCNIAAEYYEKDTEFCELEQYWQERQKKKQEKLSGEKTYDKVWDELRVALNATRDVNSNSSEYDNIIEEYEKKEKEHSKIKKEYDNVKEEYHTADKWYQEKKYEYLEKRKVIKEDILQASSSHTGDFGEKDVSGDGVKVSQKNSNTLNTDNIVVYTSNQTDKKLQMNGNYDKMPDNRSTIFSKDHEDKNNTYTSPSSKNSAVFKGSSVHRNDEFYTIPNQDNQPRPTNLPLGTYIDIKIGGTEVGTLAIVEDYVSGNKKINIGPTLPPFM